jgi:hypothetical protein
MAIQIQTQFLEMIGQPSYKMNGGKVTVTITFNSAFTKEELASKDVTRHTQVNKVYESTDALLKVHGAKLHEHCIAQDPTLTPAT